jgi:hypothetical protein
LLCFRAQLEQAVAADAARRRRRLRVARPAALAAAAAIAAGVAAFLLVGGGGPSIVDRAQAALSGSQGEILHMRLLGTQSEPDGSVLHWQDESWELIGDPAARRQLEVGPDGRQVESGITQDGLAQVFDPAANTVYSENAATAKASVPAGRRSVKPVPKTAASLPEKPRSARELPAKATLDQGVAAPRTPQEKIRLLLETGKLREDGRVTVDGREAMRLVSDTADATYLVDATTGDPLEWRTTGTGGSTTLRFAVYEMLPATAANRALVSVTAQHPGATVDDDPAHYAAAQHALFPKG